MSWRIRCCVPYCRHTRRAQEIDREWICAEHWALVPRPSRRVFFRLRRRWRRGQPIASVRVDRIWTRMKRSAIERAFGV